MLLQESTSIPEPTVISQILGCMKGSIDRLDPVSALSGFLDLSVRLTL
jgi:hypothetical protein